MKLSKFNIIIPTQNSEDYILFNTLTGNTFLLDEKSKDLIENNSIIGLSEEMKKEFIDKKVLLGDEIDENKYFQYFQNRSKFDNTTLSLTLLLTWACNLRCVYCYEGAGEKKSYSMKKETAENIILFAKNEIKRRGLKAVSLILFGGEPLVNFSVGEYILENLYAYCEENNIIFTTGIVTNGTLLTPKILDVLVKYNCRYIQITLDGIKEIHDKRRIAKDGGGTFDKIIESLILLKDKETELRKEEKSLNPIIRINIDKTNIKDIDSLFDLLKEKELTSLGLDFGIVRGGTKACSSYESKCFEDDELGDLIDGLWKKAEAIGFSMGGSARPFRKWTYCGLDCDNSYTIEPNGDVYKCWEHVGEKEHKMGEVSKKGSIDKITYSFFKWMTKNPLNVEECRECKYLPVCGGGCGSVGFNETNKYESQGCFKVKGVVEKQVRKYIEKNYLIELKK